MERSVTAAEAKVAAQQQAASGLDAMLMAIGGSKKVLYSQGCLAVIFPSHFAPLGFRF